MHLDPSASPEYQREPVRDCTINLALLRWGCKTLVKICKILEIDDPRLPKWREVLETLTPYYTDENGYMIGANTPFAKAHRHYSHMMQIHPLFEKHSDNDDEVELAFKTLNHWLEPGKDGLDFCSWSYTYVAMFLSSYGHGNDALNFLNAAMEGISYNTSYDREMGPCFETPMMITTVLQEMLLQSWGGLIQVFPAIPDSWKDVTFHNLRAEGAFLVSGIRRNGETVMIRIESLAGETCRVKTGTDQQMHIHAEQKIPFIHLEDGIVKLELKKSETVILSATDNTRFNQEFTIKPVANYQRRSPHEQK